MFKLSDIVSRKFIESFDASDWEVETEDGFKSIISTNKTIEYQVYHLKLDNGLEIKCADTHILIDENYNEIYAADSLNHSIITKFGIASVISIEDLGYSENMYDLSVDSEDHTFYTNDILSHNTQTSAAYILWYVNFNDAKHVAILANKSSAAREVMSRLQLMFELLPAWLKRGVKTWNKGDIELDNASKVFTAATTGSGIRGKTCVTGDTKICIEKNGDIYYSEISNIINNSNFTNIKEDTMNYTIYKTTNITNNKIYIGFHYTSIENIITNKTSVGSIYKDGYLGSGTLIKKAIKKYGPESFYQELLGVFTTKEEAEEYESQIVNKDFTLREDTYNIAIGGNVRIMYGENNGFFGKQHTDKTKLEISKRHTNNKYFSNSNNFKIKNIETGAIYLDYVEASKNEPSITSKTILINLIGECKFEFLDEVRQTQALEVYNNTKLTNEEKHNLFSDRAKERFSGVPKSDDHKAKIGAGVSKFIEEHPEEHKTKMDKINKNLEKIRKTAEKHTGMKRSAATCENISKALRGKSSSIKGKVGAKNLETGKIAYFDSIYNIPIGWTIDLSRGTSGKKSYTDGVNYKLYIPGTEPSGWILGGAPKKK